MKGCDTKKTGARLGGKRRFSARDGRLVSTCDASIGFTNLTVSSIPANSEFEIDVSP